MKNHIKKPTKTGDEDFYSYNDFQRDHALSFPLESEEDFQILNSNLATNNRDIKKHLKTHLVSIVTSEVDLVEIIRFILKKNFHEGSVKKLCCSKSIGQK